MTCRNQIIRSKKVKCCFNIFHILMFWVTPPLLINEPHVLSKHSAASLCSPSSPSFKIHTFWIKTVHNNHIQRRREGEELAHGYQGVSTPCWFWLHDWDFCPLVDPQPSHPNLSRPVLWYNSTLLQLKTFPGKLIVENTQCGPKKAYSFY